MNACEVRLDLDKSRTYRRYRPVVLRRGELGACELRATVTDHGVEVDTEGLTPFLVAKMPSGSYYRQSGSWDDGVAVIAVDERYFASELGRAPLAYVELHDDDGEIVATTQDFPLTVLENADGGEIVEPYDSEIEDAIARVDDAVDRVDEEIERMEEVIEHIGDEFLKLTDSDIDALFEEV